MKYFIIIKFRDGMESEFEYPTLTLAKTKAKRFVDMMGEDCRNPIWEVSIESRKD